MSTKKLTQSNKDLPTFQKVLIFFFLTSMFGIDRIIYGDKQSGVIRLLFGFILIGFIFWIIDVIKYSKNKYDSEVII